MFAVFSAPSIADVKPPAFLAGFTAAQIRSFRGAWKTGVVSRRKSPARSVSLGGPSGAGWAFSTTSPGNYAKAAGECAANSRENAVRNRRDA